MRPPSLVQQREDRPCRPTGLAQRWSARCGWLFNGRGYRPHRVGRDRGGMAHVLRLAVPARLHQGSINRECNIPFTRTAVLQLGTGIHPKALRGSSVTLTISVDNRSQGLERNENGWYRGRSSLVLRRRPLPALERRQQPDHNRLNRSQSWLRASISAAPIRRTFPRPL